MRSCCRRVVVAAFVLAALGRLVAAAGQDSGKEARLLAPGRADRRASSGASIRYLLPVAVEKVAIEVVDDRGRVVQRFSEAASSTGVPGGQPLATTAGEHGITWDLHHACGTAFAGFESPAQVRELDPWAPPGTYRILLTADTRVTTVPFVIEPEPGMTATRADLEDQLQLALEMCDLRRTAFSAVARCRSESRVGAVTPGGEAAGSAAASSRPMDVCDAQAVIGTAAAGDTVRSIADGRAPWSARLAALQRKVAASDRRPDETEYAAFRGLKDELPRLLERLSPAQSRARPGASIQFDSKGVNFGPWLRAFVARVRQHWLIPAAVLAEKGHVVVKFYVEKSGRITELTVPEPSSVDAFNKAAWGAVVDANPAAPLPKEFPEKRCLFTLTFFYNETPPQ